MSMFEMRRRLMEASSLAESDDVASTLAQSFKYAQLMLVEKRRLTLAEDMRKIGRVKKKASPNTSNTSALAGAVIIEHYAKTKRNARPGKIRLIKQISRQLSSAKDARYRSAYRLAEQAVIPGHEEKYFKAGECLPVTGMHTASSSDSDALFKKSVSKNDHHFSGTTHESVDTSGVSDMNSINAGGAMARFLPDADTTDDAEALASSIAQSVDERQNEDDLASYANSLDTMSDAEQLQNQLENGALPEGEYGATPSRNDADVSQDDGEDDSRPLFSHKGAVHQAKKHRPPTHNTALKRNGPLPNDAKILREEFPVQEKKDEQEDEYDNTPDAQSGMPNVRRKYNDGSASGKENSASLFEEPAAGKGLFEEGKCGVLDCQAKGLHWHDEEPATSDVSDDTTAEALMPVLYDESDEPEFIEGYGDRSYNMALMLAPGIPTLRPPQLKPSPSLSALRPASRDECEHRCGRDGFCDPLSEFGCGGEYCLKPYRGG